VSMEASGFDEVAEALTSIPAQMAPKVKGVVSRGALNIKRQLQEEARSSPSFRPLARSIGFDLVEGSFGGDTAVEASIGPDKSRDGAAGLLGGYFGWSKGGGGSLPDPVNALLEEAPNFLENIFQLTERLEG
jgi:hypothetical protein